MPPAPEKTVWGSSSLLVQVTVEPTLTVMAAGENAKFVIDTCCVATAGPADGAEVVGIVAMSGMVVVVGDAALAYLPPDADAEGLLPHAASPPTATVRAAAPAAA